MGLKTDWTLSLRKIITSSFSAFVRQSVKQSADATSRPELWKEKICRRQGQALASFISDCPSIRQIMGLFFLPPPRHAAPARPKVREKRAVFCLTAPISKRFAATDVCFSIINNPRRSYYSWRRESIAGATRLSETCGLDLWLRSEKQLKTVYPQFYPLFKYKSVCGIGKEMFINVYFNSLWSGNRNSLVWSRLFFIIIKEFRIKFVK